VYHPDADFCGEDSFRYMAGSGTTWSDTATVTIHVACVDDLPVAVPDSYDATEDTTLTVEAPGVLGNDSDVDGPPLTAMRVTGAPDGPFHGWIAIPDGFGADGSFVYHPYADFCGDDSFRYIAGSGTVWSDVTTVTVHVACVNDAPVLDPIGSQSVMWGNELSFAATATDPDLPANVLTFSIADAPQGATLTSGGVFSWTPTSAQIGDHSFAVEVCDDGSPVLCDEETVDVAVGRRATLLVYGGDASAQYSDPAAVKATLTDNGGGDLQDTALSGKTIVFTIGTQSTSGTTNASGLAQGSITLSQPTGTPGVTSAFAEDSLYLASSDLDAFSVDKEHVTLVYSGDTLLTTNKAGGSATVNLAATAQEDLDGTLGTLLGSQFVKFTVYASAGGQAATCAAQVTGVVNGKGLAGCSVSLKADNYTVNVELVSNGHYVAEVETAAVTVTDPGTGLTAGGGWFTEPTLGVRSSFGFTAKFLKRGQIQGNSLYIYRATMDIGYGLRAYNVIFKSNAMTGLNIYNCAAGQKSGCQATFTGKCTIKAVDRETGVTYNAGGNFSFQVDVTDNGEPGAPPPGVDTYALRVWDARGTYYQVGTPGSQLTIEGGNILVRAR
jgi:hypothetical protein